MIKVRRILMLDSFTFTYSINRDKKSIQWNLPSARVVILSDGFSVSRSVTCTAEDNVDSFKRFEGYQISSVDLIKIWQNETIKISFTEYIP